MPQKALFEKTNKQKNKKNTNVSLRNPLPKQFSNFNDNTEKQNKNYIQSAWF